MLLPTVKTIVLCNIFKNQYTILTEDHSALQWVETYSLPVSWTKMLKIKIALCWLREAEASSKHLATGVSQMKRHF